MGENTGENQSKQETGQAVEPALKKKNWKKHIPLLILELVILVIAIGFMYVATRTEEEVERVEINKEEIKVNEEVKKEIEIAQENEEFTGYWNIALFGVDARDNNLGKGNRSDTIIVCSVNMDTYEVRLISVYRDTYLNLGNDTYNKCNIAYAKGGQEMALSMLNMNLDMYITDYVTIGFSGLIEAIDALGGIEMDITQVEISHLNNYQISMAEDMDITYTPVKEAGKQTLNGLQATAYCRIRYTAGDDFRRAQRQRDVLAAMLEKAKTASVSNLTKMMNALLPNVSTSLKVEDMIPVMGMLTKYKVTVSEGFPFESNRGSWTVGSKGSCVIPLTLEENVTLLHEILFEKEAYNTSKEVKTYSKLIEEETNKYKSDL